MTPKYQFAVTSGNGDPFAQLTQELATFRDEQIERQLRKAKGLNLRKETRQPVARYERIKRVSDGASSFCLTVQVMGTQGQVERPAFFLTKSGVLLDC